MLQFGDFVTFCKDVIVFLDLQVPLDIVENKN
jgi:hypothetical protein